MIDQAKDAFVLYLDQSPIDPEQKELAKTALLKPRRHGGEYGPLIDDSSFTVRGLSLSGKELIARLWIFSSQLTEPEQTNAKSGMISSLRDSYDLGGRVCNPGKAQRLVVAVLQGRLAGVNIEGGMPIQIPAAQAIAMFFADETRREIDMLHVLLAAANRFCDENRSVNRPEFIREIRAYAEQQGIS